MRKIGNGVAERERERERESRREKERREGTRGNERDERGKL